MNNYWGCSMDWQNRVSISTHACSDQPLKQVVKCLIDEGWHGIEIMAEGLHKELLDWSDEELEELKSLGLRHRIRWSIHAPIADCNLAAAGAGPIQEVMETVIRTLNIAEELGCTHVVLHPGEVDLQEEGDLHNRQEALQRVAALLEVALKATNSSQVKLALENVPPYPGLLGTDAEFLVELVTQLNSPRVGLIYDCGHAHLCGRGQAQAILEQMLPHVVGLHLSDNQGVQDDHLGLGQGNVPLLELMDILKKEAYSGTIIIETGSLEGAYGSIRWMDEWLGAPFH